MIDTNVITSALVSKNGASYVLMSLLESEKFAFHLSIALVLEYEQTCKRLVGSKIHLTEEEIDKFIDNLCALGKHHEVYFLWRPFLTDANDDMVLELAVKANCKWVVTYNSTDFRGVEKFGIKVCTPLQFLTDIGVLP